MAPAQQPAPPSFSPELLERLARQLGLLSSTAMSTPSPAAPAPAAPPASGAPLPDRIAGEVREARGLIADIIREANQTTEAETIEAGRSLERIVSESRSYVNELREGFAEVRGQGAGPGGASPGARAAGGIVPAIAEQTRATDAYLKAVADDLRAQREAARQALEQTQNILRMGATIAEVARSSKMLALNASIEAARLGQAGRSFAVIASHMQGLSERVHESNTLVSELAAGLMQLLPRVVEGSEALHERTEAFGADFHAGVDHVQQGTQRLERALQRATTGGDQRVEVIIREGQAALSHLQFQDPVAQRLMRIDKRLEVMERRLAAWLDQPELQGQIADPLQEELGGGDLDADLPESGEVMLF